MPAGTTVVWRAPGRPHPDADYASAVTRELRRHRVPHVVADVKDMILEPELRRAGRHVVTGGSISILDRDAWGRAALAAFRALVDRAAAGEHVLVGVCFGAQVIAASLPGENVLGRTAIRAGLFEVEEVPARPRPWVSAAFHYEELSPALVGRPDVSPTYLVPGGELFGFRLGSAAWAVQFHPELTPAEMRALIAANGELLRRHGLAPARAAASIDALAGRWTSELFARAVVEPLHAHR